MATLPREKKEIIPMNKAIEASIAQQMELAEELGGLVLLNPDMQIAKRKKEVLAQLAALVEQEVAAAEMA
ncbi:hypothetical protein ACOHWE_12190 [Cribrihabitans neustonicus]